MSQESRVESREPNGGARPQEAGDAPGGAFWPLMLLLVMAAGVLLVMQWRRPGALDPLVGMALPPLEVGGWLNAPRPLSVQDLRGEVVFVSFWSTTCGPCVRALPELVGFHERFRDEGLVMVGLTPEQNIFGSLEQFIAQVPGLDWPVGYGAGFTFELAGINATPTYLLFNRAGRSVWSGATLDGADDAAIAALAGGVVEGRRPD